MKKYFSFLLIILAASITKSKAGERNLELTSLIKDASGAWMYEQVIEVPGATKAQLYEKMKSWVLTTVKSVDKNSLTDDPKQETIITNPTITLPDGKYNYLSAQSLNFKLLFQFKEGKVKVTLNNITYSGLYMGTQVKQGSLDATTFNKGVIKQLNEQIDAAMNALKTSIEAAAKNDKKSDW